MMFRRRISFVLLAPAKNVFNPRKKRNIARAQADRDAKASDEMGSVTFQDVGSEARVPRGRAARKTSATLKRGSSVAHRVKSMSDGEWETVPLAEKQAFTNYMAKKLQDAPADVSEQQRRRYYETTMKDPTKLDASETVQDTFQRVKLGLPVDIHSPQRQMGLTDAMYQLGDSELFSVDDAHKIENAMDHVKQLFVDYVRKKREGVSTESERRRLANISAELNNQTQRHLANTFKFAELRVQEKLLAERRQQLQNIERLREAAKAKKAPAAEAGGTTRKQKVARALRRVYGLEPAVATTILSEMRAQEDFLRHCEALLRLTQAEGFRHTSQDEGLDRYTESLKNLYSVDAKRLARLDVVKYTAALEGLPPVDWAQRWYERALLMPLQQTKEFRRIQAIKEEEAERAKAAGVAETPTMAAAKTAEAGVVNIVEKMFVSPDDARMKSVHEKRLRYLAYTFMESQIRKMRENARIFEGAEETEEAARCRALYARIEERKKVLVEQQRQEQREDTHSGGGSSSEADLGVFRDEELSALFAELNDVVRGFVKQRVTGSKTREREQRLADLARALKMGPDSAAQALRRTVEEKKERMMHRLLGLLEHDVREDVTWVENMMEGERPPLLPVPEPMSYVSAADAAAWRDVRNEIEHDAGNPFGKGTKQGGGGGPKFNPTLLGQKWKVPDQPTLFWGTGTAAVQQALMHAAEDAERRRNGEDLAPPFPCPENPWGWRLRQDVLDDI